MPVQQIIDNAILTAQNKANLADAYTGQAIQLATGSTVIVAPVISAGEVDEPDVAIPRLANGLDTAVFDSMYAKIINDLADKFYDFFVEYLSFRPTLMPAVEAWLESTIVNGGSGINTAVERQIWQRHRDRINVEASTASEEVMTLAARGFPLPTGAMNAALVAIQRKRSAEVAAVSRDAAIQAFEAEKEMVKFAISQAIDYRTKAIAAAVDYIRALAVAPNIASSLSTQSADAQARLISAVASYYNARINSAELEVKVASINADNNLKAITTQAGLNADYSKQRVGAAVAAAESLGQQAAASLNGLNATASLQESVD